MVAIFTKFDDLTTQVYDDELEKKFQKPLDGFKEYMFAWKARTKSFDSDIFYLLT